MTAIEILRNLETDGYEVAIDGQEICIRGPAPLDRNLLQKLKDSKSAIMEYLTSPGREFSAQISQSGLLPKWKNYLLERVGILTKFEGYSLESAREEVLAMIPYYKNLN